MLPIDWFRVPRDEQEKQWCDRAAKAAMQFLLSIRGIADHYRGNDARVADIVRPVMLGLWDGYLSGHRLKIEKDTPNWPATSEADEQFFIRNVISALSHPNLVASFDPIEDADGETTGYVLEAGESAVAEFSKAKGAALDHSQILDVHTWSDHPEVNSFVDHIYGEIFSGGNEGIRKKHLKVLLLDLYVKWKIDPSLKTSVARDVNAYEPKTRYNALHISKTTIRVVDRLLETHLIHQAIGIFDRSKQTGWTTRIWPSGVLSTMFEEAQFGSTDIGDFPDKETIVLRDADKNDIEYTDTAETNRMRAVVRSYNDLLRRTFIDIPTLETTFIETTSGRKSGRVYVNQRDKFVRRVFNRGSFDKGGRFYGGWWERCPKGWRDKIFIDDKPTVELDYSGLHIVLLYALAGIDYWKDIGSDPYAIELPDFDGTADELRDVCKQLLLVALNAKDETATFRAFRSEAAKGSSEKRMSNEILSKILDSLKVKHKPIADRIANDAGIDLMRIDSDAAETVIAHFTEKGIPILAIHDSFIVQSEYETELDRQMGEAFRQATKGALAKIKDASPLPDILFLQSSDKRLSALTEEGRKIWKSRIKPDRTARYLHELEQFRDLLASKAWADRTDHSSDSALGAEIRR